MLQYISSSIVKPQASNPTQTPNTINTPAHHVPRASKTPCPLVAPLVFVAAALALVEAAEADEDAALVVLAAAADDDEDAAEEAEALTLAVDEVELATLAADDAAVLELAAAALLDAGLLLLLLPGAALGWVPTATT